MPDVARDVRQSAGDYHAAVERLRELVVGAAKPASDRALAHLYEWLGPLDYDSDPPFDADVVWLRKHPEALIESTAEVAGLAFELLELVGDAETLAAAEVLREDVALYQTGRRRCVRCGLVLPVPDFGEADLTIDGSGHKRRCRQCEATDVRGV